MRFNNETFSRAEVASDAGLTGSQIEYLIKQDVLIPDVGGQRKRFSSQEAVIAKIAGAFVPHVHKMKILKEPMEALRQIMTWPEVKLPDDLNEISAFLVHEYLRERRAAGKFDESYHVERARIDLFPARYPKLGFRGNRFFYADRIKELRAEGKVNVEAMIAAVDAEIYQEMQREPLLSEAEWLKTNNALRFWKAVHGQENYYLMSSVNQEGSYWFHPDASPAFPSDKEELPSAVVTVLNVKRLFESREG